MDRRHRQRALSAGPRWKRAWAAIALAAWLLASPPALARPHAAAPILGTMPAYPGATRPLRHWENARLAIALTPDKPAAVVAYYLNKLPGLGWTADPGITREATAAAAHGEPAWLTFRQAGRGRIDIQVTRGRQPKTGQWLTLVHYQTARPKL